MRKGNVKGDQNLETETVESTASQTKDKENLKKNKNCDIYLLIIPEFRNSINMNTKMDHQSMKIGFIGGGNIAQAIATGLLEKGVLIPRNIWVSSRTENTLSRWKMFEVHTTLKNGQVVENCDVIFLAVKPHLLDSMVQDTVNTLTQTATSKLFISVLAGVPLDTLMNKLLCISPNPRIVRSMPNTPMMVGEGIIVYCSKNTTLADQDLVNMLFSCTGITECVPESLINAISGLSGSGPAYVYLMIEAFADGAVKMGVPRDMATKFAAQVMVGAGKMVLHSGKHPGQLKDEVCSPGGTTIVGIHALECGSVRCAVMNAIEAAVKKSDSLSSKSQ